MLRGEYAFIISLVCSHVICWCLFDSMFIFVSCILIYVSHSYIYTYLYMLLYIAGSATSVLCVD